MAAIPGEASEPAAQAATTSLTANVTGALRAVTPDSRRFRSSSVSIPATPSTPAATVLPCPRTALIASLMEAAAASNPTASGLLGPVSAAVTAPVSRSNVAAMVFVAPPSTPIRSPLTAPPLLLPVALGSNSAGSVTRLSLRCCPLSTDVLCIESHRPIYERITVRLDYLALGNPTLDVQAGGSSVLGGSVVYSALQAARLGLSAGIVGRANPAQLEPYWQPYAGEVGLRLQPAELTTMFRNVSAGDSREQWLEGWSGAIQDLGDLPDSDILHIAPVAQEISWKSWPGRAGHVSSCSPRRGWSGGGTASARGSSTCRGTSRPRSRRCWTWWWCPRPRPPT